MCPHYYHIIRHDNTISVPREGLAGVGDTVGGNDFHIFYKNIQNAISADSAPEAGMGRT